ncbi:MAG TPA: sigma 54-interacting transcriptional regulator [Myxococcales bacterium]|nr:sigma 54-interacting transcriptional regulator [Myxococcales bacterium]
MLGALAGESQQAEAALLRARSLVRRGEDPLVHFAWALVEIETGNPARAQVHLERARRSASLAREPCGESVLLLLQAQALAPEGSTPAALQLAAEALKALPGNIAGEPCGVYARLAAARLALGAGDASSAASHLERIADAPGRAGVLAGRADVLQARVDFSRKRQVEDARALLDRAIARFDRIGAQRDLGLAYLVRGSQASADAGDSPSTWLARAQPLLARVGGPRDLALLRNAFRSFGRRMIDRAQTDFGRAMIELGERRTHLQEVVSTHCESTGGGPCSNLQRCAGYDAIDDVLDVVASAEEHLIAALEHSADDRARLGQLALATQEIASIDDFESLVEATPELALLVCPATSAALLRVQDGRVETLSSRGGRFEAAQGRIEDAARSALSPVVVNEWRLAGTAPGASLAALPLAHDVSDLVLVVERASPGTFKERDVEQLGVYASLAGTALARVRTAAALRDSAARDAATLGAIRDGVLAIDANGVLRALNQAAAGLLGVRREQAVGMRLRDLPGLAQLATALSARPNLVGDTIALPRGDVLVRSHGYSGGVVATLRDVATEQTIAHRLVGSVARFNFDDVVGEDAAFVRVIEDARRAAASEIPVLISGESGTGKELLAQAIHNASAAASQPFVAINVTAIPRELLESELFGYEGGSFTGARTTGRAGKFELVGRGTLLLDEIGDMPLEMQAKLLRVLQERVLQRLGSVRDVRIRARIIATTHHDLEEAVKAGRFRLDLYHRLRVLNLRLPPLREHKSDVRVLVEHQLRSIEQHRRQKIGIAPEVLRAFDAYDWPGNVRELVNLVEAEVSLLPPGQTVLTRIPPALANRGARGGGAQVVSLVELERRACQDAIARFDGNVAAAARALGIAKGTLYAKMKRYRIKVPAGSGQK